MEKVNELIDPDEFLAIPSEREFALDIVRENDNVLNLPGHDAIAQFFHSPVVLHSLLKNLKKTN